MRKMIKRRNVYFDEFFDDVKSRSELVATFYAVLELLKAGRILLEREYSGDGTENIILSLNREHNIKKKEEEEAS